MTIQHKVCEGGRAQSLDFTAWPTGSMQEMSIGVLESAGRHNFGVAKRRQRIRVILGNLTSKGKVSKYYEGSPCPARTIVFEAGEEIVLECREVTAYICFYDRD